MAELYSVDRKLGKVYNDYRNKKNANRIISKKDYCQIILYLNINIYLIHFQQI